jgi:DNA-binding LacI/PurR family transcriptional regulator
MANLKDVADMAGVPLLTAFQAMSNGQVVTAAESERVVRAAAELRYTLHITIRDVAALAGVSVTTASYVINDNPLIQIKTRDRVKDAIQALGYRPNSTARNLKASETRMIGYAWHRVQDQVQRNPILDRFLYEMAHAAEARGYHVLTFAQSDQAAERAYTDLVRTSRVDGFVLSDTTYEDRRIHKLQELGIPFAAFGRADSAVDFPFADDDGHQGIGLVVAHLRARGHTRIAMIGWPRGTVVGDTRVQGYIDALRSSGIDPQPAWLVRTPNDVPHAAKAAESVLRATPCPTAIICATDIIAIGVRLYLERSGISKDRPIAIASYDDTPVAEALDLTSVHQQIDVIAHTVTDMLIGEIRGAPAAKRHVLVAPNLVVRASSMVGGIGDGLDSMVDGTRA